MLTHINEELGNLDLRPKLCGNDRSTLQFQAMGHKIHIAFYRQMAFSKVCVSTSHMLTARSVPEVILLTFALGLLLDTNPFCSLLQLAHIFLFIWQLLQIKITPVFLHTLSNMCFMYSRRAISSSKL